MTLPVLDRAREVELLVAALDGGAHVLLEGPPGTGKSTLLRSVSTERAAPFHLVEGNAELTPARLVGHFDPAQVLAQGYVPDVFVDGPLVSAMARSNVDLPVPGGPSNRRCRPAASAATTASSSARRPTTDIPRILGLYQSGDIKLDEIITRTYTLDQVNEGYDDLLAGKNVRGVVVHSHN